MKKEFVPYEVALKLKAIGFDEPCFGYFIFIENENKKLIISSTSINPKNSELINEAVASPTFSQSFRFFRDNYGIFHNVDKIFSDEFGYIITSENDEPLNDFDFNTWEEAELACLEKLLEIVESKSK